VAEAPTDKYSVESHTVSGEHTRSVVEVDGMDWYWRLPQEVSASHCLSEVAVGAVTSNSATLLQAVRGVHTRSEMAVRGVDWY
jgi:hypothetical protein